jgi:hypothetical protein
MPALRLDREHTCRQGDGEIHSTVGVPLVHMQRSQARMG